MFKIKKILQADYIAYMCLVRFSEQTETFALYFIKWLVFVTELESVYCAVRIESLYNTDTIRLQRVKLDFWHYNTRLVDYQKDVLIGWLIDWFIHSLSQKLYKGAPT